MVISIDFRICILLILFMRLDSIYGLDFPLNGQWRFLPIDQDDVSAGEDDRAKTYSSKELNDTEWESITVPGYWDQPPGAWPWSNPQRTGGPHPKFDGEAWYRFRFSVPENLFPNPESSRDFHAVLRFEGVSAQASVWLNGTFVGRHLGAYGPFDLNVTEAISRTETNVIAVRVRDKSVFHSGGGIGREASSSVIPLGFDPNAGGIHRDVHLKITPKERIQELAVVSDPRSATVHVSLSPESIGSSTLTLEVIEKSTGRKLEFGQPASGGVIRVNGGEILVRLRDFGPEVTPKPWSPESPNLYRITAKLINSRGDLDIFETDFGFRSFAIKGGVFHLNESPYFLFGAGSPPHYELPSEDLVRAHLSYLKEAGVRIVRFAHEPPSQIWLRVCNELGLLAWLDGPLSAERTPYNLNSAELVDYASREMQELVRALRNHPSVCVWTVGSGNARKLKDDVSRRVAEKNLTLIADEMSSHDKDAIVIPESDSRGLIESAIEDWHSGLGWYQGKNADWLPFLKLTSSSIDSTTHPWVCSALETGYSTNGQGRIVRDPIEETASRMRIGSPGEDRDRLLFTQSSRIKELIQVTRAQRNPERNRIAGIFPFTCANWFFYPLTEGAIRPKPLLASIREAYQPIILTIETPRKNYYAGELLETTVTIVNDSIDQQVLSGWNLALEAFIGDEGPVSQTQRENLEIAPFTSDPFSMVVVLPEDILGLQRVRINARFFRGEEELATNQTEILIAPVNWSRPRSETPFGKVLIYDKPNGSLQAYLEKFSLKAESLTSLEQLNSTAGLIVGSGAFDDYIHRAWPTLYRWIESGGRMVVLDQPLGSDRWVFSGPYPPGYRIEAPPGWPSGFDRANVQSEGHSVFEGIRAETLENWGSDRVVAHSILRPNFKVSQQNHRVLVDAAVHSSTPEWGRILVEDRIAEGSILYTQLDLTAKATLDPIACKVLSNLVDWAGDSLAPVTIDLDEDLPPFEAPLVGSPLNEITAPLAGTGEG